jgi:chemotaxis family two-component system sensor kinase Cph1
MTKIKDIVNRDLVNLTNCESEPIHIPGSIQPHGFLFAVRMDDYVIDFCSANCLDYIQVQPSNVLGKNLATLCSGEEVRDFDSYIQMGNFDHSKPFVFTINQIPYNTTVHKSGKLLVLELEPFPDGSKDLPNLYSQTRKFVSFMEGTAKMVELCREIAEETRLITGYDRVMIYHFDAEYNGEVIAESKREDLDSFANQKYPHTDIPAQARELYIRNPMRMIADVNYEPVPLLTLDSHTATDNQSLDLSLSVLRSVSPIHVEYLKNMGVRATLTISLLKGQKLWGLIACHHYSPKILPHYTRLSALLQGHFLASQIGVREVAEEFEVAQNTEHALQQLLSLLEDYENPVEAFYRSPMLLRVANAEGAIIIHDGKIFKNGNVPSDEDTHKLNEWLRKTYGNNQLATACLPELYPQGELLAKHAAGLIYYSLSENSSILWLRPEVVHTINWAGNPNKAVGVNEDGNRLTPRKSFELWMEVVKNKSIEWRKSELNGASSFAHALQKHINLNEVSRQEEKYRALNEDLKAANKELANLNWISTHDLKEPLRKIQIFASKILASDISDNVKDSVERMSFAARRMQRLIEDILNYSKAGNMEKIFVETDLEQVLREVLLDLHEAISETGAVITSEPMPVMLAIPFQLSQLFVNLIGNSLKFINSGSVPNIHISVSEVHGFDFPRTNLSPERSYHKIDFTDNGIGFEEEYNGRIFDVFQRLHPSNKYPGTGIGLAICRKIVENHKGTIIADSMPGKGSVFSIFLPIT